MSSETASLNLTSSQQKRTNWEKKMKLESLLLTTFRGLQSKNWVDVTKCYSVTE